MKSYQNLTSFLFCISFFYTAGYCMNSPESDYQSPRAHKINRTYLTIKNKDDAEVKQIQSLKLQQYILEKEEYYKDDLSELSDREIAFGTHPSRMNALLIAYMDALRNNFKKKKTKKDEVELLEKAAHNTICMQPLLKNIPTISDVSEYSLLELRFYTLKNTLLDFKKKYEPFFDRNIK